MQVRDAVEADRDWIRARLLESWGSTRMVLRGELMEVLGSPALIAGDGEGLLHHRTLSEGVGEIVTLDAFERRRGIGTALVNAYLERAGADGLREVRVITTNDNVDALRFYQSRGFVIRAVRVNAMEAARKLKPEIPPTGLYGLPIRDEIELARNCS